MWTAEVLRKLCGCASSPEPLLCVYAITALFPWQGSFLFGIFSNVTAVIYLQINAKHPGKNFHRQHWFFSSFFLLFPRKQVLTFHTKCLHQRQFSWNVKSCFMGKIRKKKKKKSAICCLLNKPRDRSRLSKSSKLLGHPMMVRAQLFKANNIVS